MAKKSYPIQIWFLDDDLHKSAQYQTNSSLTKSISGCMQSLINVLFYFSGIRTHKIYKHLFAYEIRKESMEKYFPLWPLQQKPFFRQYLSRESKWCRKCLEHVEYTKTYMSLLLDEYEYRFNRQHKLTTFLDWYEHDAPQFSIPKANIDKVTIPWKNLDPRFRRKDLVRGYQLMFMSKFTKHPIDEFARTKRDMPEFVVEHFKFDLEN